MPTIITDPNLLPLADDGFNIVRGCFDGVTWINKFGKNSDCSVGDAVWSPQTAIPDMTGLSGPVSVVSTSAADDVGSTGAFTVLIDGLDEDHQEIQETVTLDGTTPVLTVGSFHWINTAKVVTGGTFAGNAGVITMTSTDTGTPLMGQIEINMNRTQTAQFMVPTDHVAFMRLPQITLQNTGNNTLMDLACFIRHHNGVDELLFDVLLQAGGVEGFQQKDWTAPLTFPSKSIIYWKVLSLAGGGTFNLVVDYDIWLVHKNNTFG